MFLDELDLAGLQRMSLGEFIIVKTQAQIHVVDRENLPAKIYEKWKMF
jgi:hypothetical protein